MTDDDDQLALDTMTPRRRPDGKPELGEYALPGDVPPTITLAGARAQLRKDMMDGTVCPCCEQHVGVYRWVLYSTAVQLLAALYRVGGTREFVEAKVVKPKGSQGDGSRLRFWGLAELKPGPRSDGGKPGWWRVTPLGERYLRGHKVPRFAWVYDGRVLFREGEPRGFRDGRKVEFDYDSMLRGLFPDDEDEEGKLFS